MDAQEIFDTVRDHLLQQGKKSLLSIASCPRPPRYQACAYRSPDGLKCAVGCLISDEEYSPYMEKKTVKYLEAVGLMPERLRGEIRLLELLQHIHDFSSPEKWETKLRALADDLRLEWR